MGKRKPTTHRESNYTVKQKAVVARSGNQVADRLLFACVHLSVPGEEQRSRELLMWNKECPNATPHLSQPSKHQLEGGDAKWNDDSFLFSLKA